MKCSISGEEDEEEEDDEEEEEEVEICRKLPVSRGLAEMIRPSVNVSGIGLSATRASKDIVEAGLTRPLPVDGISVGCVTTGHWVCDGAVLPEK